MYVCMYVFSLLFKCDCPGFPTSLTEETTLPLLRIFGSVAEKLPGHMRRALISGLSVLLHCIDLCVCVHAQTNHTVLISVALSQRLKLGSVMPLPVEASQKFQDCFFYFCGKCHGDFDRLHRQCRSLWVV